MARRAYKRRRTRKSSRSSKKRRYTRRYRKKAKTATGKLWKYVKKATKSEVKRCDMLYPKNWTYLNTAPTGGGIANLIPLESRYLFVLRFSNNGLTESANFSDHDPWSWVAQHRFWSPYQLTFDMDKGTYINQRVGNKIYAKYINLKIGYHSNNTDFSSHYASLYFVQIKRSVSASYTSQAIMASIWEGIGNFCREGHKDEIYSYSLSDANYQAYRTLMATSYANKRRRYLKGIKIRKLFSTHSNFQTIKAPKYTWDINGAYAVGTNIVGQADTALAPAWIPQENTGITIPIQKYTQRISHKMIPINREWNYAMSSSESSVGIDEYKYYLIALCSDYKKNVGVSTANTADQEFFVSGELVYTDK